MTEEIWKILPECDAYKISNLGRVMRVKAGKGTRAMKIIKPCSDKNGRMVFNVSCGAIRKQMKLHRAVMSAFVGPCPTGYEVAHRDGNQSNNVLCNLIYATPKENNSHKIEHGTKLVGSDVWCSKLTDVDVLNIRKEYPGASYAKLAKKYGVSVGSIVQVVKRISWKHI